MKHLKLLTFIMLILSVAACGGAAPATAEATPIPTVVADDTIISEGRLEPIHYVELSLNTSGLVNEVLKTEGETVSAGDVIVSLTAEESQTLTEAQAAAAQALTEAHQEYRIAQIKLDDFYVPSKFTGMTPTEAVDAMLVKLNEERVLFEPYRHLDAKKLKLTEEEEKGERKIEGIAKIRKKALDDAWALYKVAVQWLELETNFQNAQIRLTNAQNDYDAIYDNSFSIESAGARSILANAELRAPFAGVITDLDVKVGEFATSNEPVVTIADTSHWIVKTTDLTEIDVVNVEEGQSVTVKLDALPDIELKGNVLSIADNYSENQGDVVYEVTILLTDVDPEMRWGMTAVVTFE